MSFIANWLAAATFAQASENTFAESWALVLFCVFLGVSIALLPARRTSEVKRPKDD